MPRCEGILRNEPASVTSLGFVRFQNPAAKRIRQTSLLDSTGRARCSRFPRRLSWAASRENLATETFRGCAPLPNSCPVRLLTPTLALACPCPLYKLAPQPHRT